MPVDNDFATSNPANEPNQRQSRDTGRVLAFRTKQTHSFICLYNPTQMDWLRTCTRMNSGGWGTCASKARRMWNICKVIFRGACRTNGTPGIGLGGSGKYKNSTLGAERSEGIGVAPKCRLVDLHARCKTEESVPLFPMRYVLNPISAKLSAWYIIRGLRPISPSTRMATECSEGLRVSRDRYHSQNTKSPRTTVAKT